jgi:hypothetical protein
MARQPVDFNYYLGRKYALLQQQADATSQTADATTKNAATNAVAASAAANLDNTRATLLPGESKAGIAKTQAETGLLGEQTRLFEPTALANIANTNASTFKTGIEGSVLRREGLMERSILPESLQSVMGSRGYTGYRLGGDAAPVQRRAAPPRAGYRAPNPEIVRRLLAEANPRTAEELDRLNGL